MKPLVIAVITLHILTVAFGNARPQVAVDSTARNSVSIGAGNARPQAAVDSTASTSVTAAIEARDRAIAAAKAATTALAESGSQAGTNDFIVGTALANVAKAAANAATVAARVASGDGSSVTQLSGAFRQVTSQAQSAGSIVENLLRSVLGPGTDGIFGLLSGSNLPILGSSGTDAVTSGPLVEVVRSLVGTTGRATTAANAVAATTRVKTKKEAESKLAAAEKAALEAENLAREVQSTAATTDVIPGTEITAQIMRLVAEAVAAAARTISEAAKSTVERLSLGTSTIGGITGDRQNSIISGLLSPILM